MAVPRRNSGQHEPLRRTKADKNATKNTASLVWSSSNRRPGGHTTSRIVFLRSTRPYIFSAAARVLCDIPRGRGTAQRSSHPLTGGLCQSADSAIEAEMPSVTESLPVTHEAPQPSPIPTGTQALPEAERLRWLGHQCRKATTLKPKGIAPVKRRRRVTGCMATALLAGLPRLGQGIASSFGRRGNGKRN